MLVAVVLVEVMVVVMVVVVAVMVVVVKFWRFGVPQKNNLGKQWEAQVKEAQLGVSPKKQ